MKFVLYGMPCAGKTILLKALNGRLRVINGSTWLKEQSDGKFSDLPEDQKKALRIQYAEFLNEFPDDNIISDGHYAFEDTVVFTEADGDAYDVFMYLYCEPHELWCRMQKSEKNIRFASMTEEFLSTWQNREIEQLRLQCYKRNKDFYVLPSNQITASDFLAFINSITNGFSSYQLASDLADQIMTWYPSPTELILVDGDKTYIQQDSFRVCSNGFQTTVFDGNFYTGYQSFCFDRETRSIQFDYEELKKCTLNRTVVSCIQKQNSIVLSAGISSLWDKLRVQFKIPYVIASPLISADTKYYIAKRLHAAGYRIIAYGDSKNDLYLLKEADKGYLYIGDRLSRSLVSEDTSSLHIVHKASPFILDAERNDEVTREIAICKSTSGINGSRLAMAHFDLGRRIGQRIRTVFPNRNTAVLVLDRGGRFFGDGVYIGFGGQLFPYNPKKDACPLIRGNQILIVDSVINTGKSTLSLIKKLKANNPKAQFCIVSNVIQEDALSVLKDHTVYAVRLSANKFVGKRQAKQVGNAGPDTADRLFNLIPD